MFRCRFKTRPYRCEWFLIWNPEASVTWRELCHSFYLFWDDLHFPALILSCFTKSLSLSLAGAVRLQYTWKNRFPSTQWARFADHLSEDKPLFKTKQIKGWWNPRFLWLSYILKKIILSSSHSFTLDDEVSPVPSNDLSFFFMKLQTFVMMIQFLQSWYSTCDEVHAFTQFLRRKYSFCVHRIPLAMKTGFR